MKKELYLYSPFYDFVAEALIQQIEDNSDNDITLRENTPGGSVYAAYGVYTKIKEHGNVHLKVDGCAMSAGAFLPLYCNSSECLDVSRFVFHRADMYVSNDQDQEFLDGINADLKAQMKKKIDSKKFKDITGFSIEDMFNPDQRIDITLTGKQAKDIGLIDKVVKLTPAMQAEITALNSRYAVAASVDSEPKKPIPNTKTMNKEKLKAEHPEIYNEIFAAGIAQEKDRVESILAFIEVDHKGVKAAIEAGKPLSQKQMSEFALKNFSAEALKQLNKEKAEDVETGEVPEGSVVKGKEEVVAFEKNLRKKMGLDKNKA